MEEREKNNTNQKNFCLFFHSVKGAEFLSQLQSFLTKKILTWKEGPKNLDSRSMNNLMDFFIVEMP